MNFFAKFFIVIFFSTIGSSVFGQGGTWTPKNDFGGQGRSDATSFSIGDKGYLGGGQRAFFNYEDFWEYDPISDAWMQKVNIPSPGLVFSVGFAIGNKGYAGLGRDVTNPGDFYEYDPVQNVWNQVASFPGTNTGSAAAFVINNKGYVGTGGNPSTKELWEFDPISNSWTQKQDFGGEPRRAAMSFSINGKGYIGCGFYRNSSGDIILYNDFWEYNPQTDQWIQKSNFEGTPRSSGIGFSLRGRGFFGNGYPEAQGYWMYYPGTDDWTQITSSSAGLTSGTSFVINDRAYVGTGYIILTGTIFFDWMSEYENDALSIQEVDIQNTISIYPNPAGEQIFVHSSEAEILKVTVYDLNGKQILSSNSIEINVSQLSPGMYFALVVIDGKTTAKKFVKL